MKSYPVWHISFVAHIRTHIHIYIYVRIIYTYYSTPPCHVGSTKSQRYGRPWRSKCHWLFQAQQSSGGQQVTCPSVLDVKKKQRGNIRHVCSNLFFSEKGWSKNPSSTMQLQNLVLKNRANRLLDVVFWFMKHVAVNQVFSWQFGRGFFHVRSDLHGMIGRLG